MDSSQHSFSDVHKPPPKVQPFPQKTTVASYWLGNRAAQVPILSDSEHFANPGKIYTAARVTQPTKRTPLLAVKMQGIRSGHDARHPFWCLTENRNYCTQHLLPEKGTFRTSPRRRVNGTREPHPNQQLTSGRKDATLMHDHTGKYPQCHRRLQITPTWFATDSRARAANLSASSQVLAEARELARRRR